MTQLLDPGKGQREKAKKTQRLQEEQIAKQKQAEDLRLAEEKSEVERRKAAGAAGRGGRSLLIQTSQTGVQGQAQTLGGS